MLRVSTRIPATSNGGLAWWVKCTLDGFALGCAPMFRSWRLPPLYESGVRFAYEPEHGSGEEDFAQPPDVYLRQWGDCDDLITYRLSEMLSASLPRGFYQADERSQSRALERMRNRMGAGKLPATRCRWQGESLHVLIRFPDGSEEDPSLLLGAPQP